MFRCSRHTANPDRVRKIWVYILAPTVLKILGLKHLMKKQPMDSFSVEFDIHNINVLYDETLLL